MKMNEQSVQRLRRVSNRVIPQFSKRTIWIVRSVILVLVALWIAGGLYLNYQVKQDEQRIEQNRIEVQRREEFLRRGAQYRQDLQERTGAPRVRNVFDGR